MHIKNYFLVTMLVLNMQMFFFFKVHQNLYVLGGGGGGGKEWAAYSFPPIDTKS